MALTCVLQDAVDVHVYLKKMLLDSNMDINANDMLTPDAVLGAVVGATPLVAPPIDKLCDGPTTKQGNSAGSIDQSA